MNMNVIRTFTITNNNYNNSSYKYDMGNNFLNTNNKFLKLVKITFDKSYFNDNPIVLEFVCDNTDVSTRQSNSSPAENYEYCKLFTLCDNNLVYDDYYYSYTLPYDIIKKLNPTETKREFNFYIRNHYETITNYDSVRSTANLEINTPFSIEMAIID
jgi:hypothetical protein